ncbi:MAG: hypothetical protein AAF434_13915 [Pseudomonadota bacterium]
MKILITTFSILILSISSTTAISNDVNSDDCSVTDSSQYDLGIFAENQRVQDEIEEAGNNVQNAENSGSGSKSSKDKVKEAVELYLKEKRSDESICGLAAANSKKNLERMVSFLQQEIKSMQIKLQTSFATGLGEDETEALVGKLALYRENLNVIDAVLPIEREPDQLLIPYDAYADYHIGFYTGVDFLSVDDLFEEGNPRLGLMIYRKKEDYSTADPGWLDVTPHVYANFQLSNAGEQSDETEDEIEKALEADVGVFWPIRKGNFDNVFELSGPILTLGGRKVDSEEEFARRRYLGYRWAANPEFYFEMLFGKSDGFKSKRMELRGQFPVQRFDNRTAIHLGFRGNLGVQDREKDNLDTLNVYLQWNVPFSSIWNSD